MKSGPDNEHHAAVLAILFKIAGVTFKTHVDPVVIDPCFEILKSHQYSTWGRGLVQASAFSL